MDFSERRLPHLYAIGQPIFVTFRLHGSLPAGREFPKESMTSGEAFVAMDRLVDTARYGPVYLKQPRVAELVRSSVRHCGQADCDLHAWVIMPNRVHLLFTPHTNVSSLLCSLKGFSARQVNKLLGSSGQPFWQNESYDRLVRTAEEFRSIEKYIVNNPVKAGLVASPEQFPWSSGAGVHACGGSPDPPHV